MINILTFRYLHRDESDFKDCLSVRLLDPSNRSIEELEIAVRTALLAGEFFYPEDVGLARSEYVGEHEWHEFDHLEISASWLSDTIKPTLQDFDVFLEKLRASRDTRSPNSIFHPPVIHTKPRMVPMRMFISALEMRRKWRGTRALLQAIQNPDIVALTIPKADWEVITTALALDAESFGGSVADEISGALRHVEEW